MEIEVLKNNIKILKEYGDENIEWFESLNEKQQDWLLEQVDNMICCSGDDLTPLEAIALEGKGILDLISW
jgi:hypothetical protein